MIGRDTRRKASRFQEFKVKNALSASISSEKILKKSLRKCFTGSPRTMLMQKSFQNWTFRQFANDFGILRPITYNLPANHPSSGP